MELKLPPSKIDIPVFRRAVEFPEYHESFSKHLPSHVALYQGHNIGSSSIAKEVINEITFLKVPDLVVFGSPQPVIDFLPQISQRLEIGKTLCFEVNTLLRQAYAFGSDLYCKGIAVKKHDEDLVEVSELAIEHPGMIVSGIGINRGWYYTIDESGAWTRTTHANECPCGDNKRHEFMFGCLTIVEHWFCDPDGYEGL
eukprot:GHVU01156690.1.p1 GENE.GHVU01156690.1~~GHVU01156690.1.p1  ORF type:complete len:198 (+),score=9.15 GHVU01156690.1:341-934(+)